MNNSNEDYNYIIDNIKKKRKWIFIITVFAIVITINLCNPVFVEGFSEEVISRCVHPIVTVIFVLLIIIGMFIANAIVYGQVFLSLYSECDPLKHLALNSAINKKYDYDNYCCIDYFYLGDFNIALSYADNMISTGKNDNVIKGVLSKIRCYFFLEDINNLRESIQQFDNIIQNNKKAQNTYQNIRISNYLMLALLENDHEKIRDYFGKVKTWNNTNLNKGFIDYLKGAAAYVLENSDECLFRMMSVKEICSKTFLGEKADEYLQKITHGKTDDTPTP